jgi:hydroxymethylbilane synthase
MTSSLQSSSYLIATRKSPLALWQAGMVQQELKNRGVEALLYPLTTTGDRFQKTKLSALEVDALMKDGTYAPHLSTGKGLFIKEIQEALLAEKAHIAVHSMKDLPVAQTPGLKIAALSRRASPYDALILSPAVMVDLGIGGGISLSNISYEDLVNRLLKSPAFCRQPIGTTSLRRQMCIKKHWGEHLVLEVLRGNVDTRLKRLQQGDFGAILLARAGIERLGLVEQIERSGCGIFNLPLHIFIPAPAQGVIAIEVHEHADAHLLAALSGIHDEPTAQQVRWERAALDALGGDCHAAVGAYLEGSILRVFYAQEERLDSIRQWEIDVRTLDVSRGYTDAVRDSF